MSYSPDNTNQAAPIAPASASVEPPAPQVSQPTGAENMVSQDVLKNRLAEKDRKHQKDMEALQAEVERLKAGGLPGSVQPQVQSVPVSDIPQIVKQVISSAAQEKARDDSEKQKRDKEERAAKALGDTMSKISEHAKANPDFVEMLNQKGEGLVPHFESLLGQLIDEDEPHLVIAKLANKPEALAAYASGDEFERKRLLNRLAKEAHSEKVGARGVVSTGSFATKTLGGSGQKDPSNMSAAEYKAYMKSQGKY